MEEDRPQASQTEPTGFTGSTTGSMGEEHAPTVGNSTTTDPPNCKTKFRGDEGSEAPRMPEMPPDGGEDGWRSFYEHPLTAATQAMLVGESNEEQSGNMNLIQEYYKQHQHQQQLPPIDPKQNALTDIWGHVSSAATSVIHVTPNVSKSNGVGPDPSHNLISDPDVEIYLNPSVKPEPQDLRKVAHSKTGLNGGVLTNGDIIVKNEPEENSSPVTNGVLESIHSPPTPHTPHTPATPMSEHDQLPSYSSATQQQQQQQQFSSIAFDGGAQYGVLQNAQVVFNPSSVDGSNQFPPTATSIGTANNDLYRDYYAPANTDGFPVNRQQVAATYQDIPTDNQAFVERYLRQQNGFKQVGGLTVDLPSPDSGIGEASITPRDGMQQIFDYTEQLSGGQIINPPPSTTPNPNRRPWHDYSRTNDADKIQIPKLYPSFGYRFYLESPISNSQRREDDRITYINKGQFYGITMEYIPDPEKPMKNQTVKSMVMLLFREEKTVEEETKAWQFWHSRQHSVKQRILDADTKNSVGIVGCIEETSHNAISVYWNPLESHAKINVAVQCLSTDFSNQKGVKGLPLHFQIDTFEDIREPGSKIAHRSYCQIKVFCDKGAERKTRDEERRAAKRKLSATGRKKMDELYHPTQERSEFYTMSDLNKPPALFTPSEDLDKMSSMELNFYSHQTPEETNNSLDRKPDCPMDPPAPAEIPFPIPPIKRAKPAPSDRVMLYVRQDHEEIFYPIHLVPPSLTGLTNAIGNKFKLCTTSIKSIYKRNRKGITVTMDDDMIRHYCNEDTFLIDISKHDMGGYDVTLSEL